MAVDTLYFLHHTHTDVGFTHEQPIVMDLHDQFIDLAIEHCQQTADYPAGSALRWTCEVSYPVLHWLKTRCDHQVQRFVELVKQGRIDIAAMFSVTSQCLSSEALHRQLYAVDRLRKDYGLPIRSAMQCDINGQHWGLVEALRDAGIDGFAMAINQVVGRAPFSNQRPNAFQWEGITGQRLLTWNGLHYNNNQYFGIPDDYDRAVEQLPRFLDWLEQRDYPYPFTMFQASHNRMNDNGPPDPRLSDFVRRWNQEGRTPRMQIVTLTQFLDQVRKEPASRMPVHRGEWTDFWNVGCASTAYETALNRGTHDRLYEAEMIRAMLADPHARKAQLDDAWENALLFDEHTWDANTAVTQPHRLASRSISNHKKNNAYRARAYAQMVRREGLDHLARDVQSSRPGRHVMVLNPLPWPRRQRVELLGPWLEGLTVPAPSLVLDADAPRETLDREATEVVSQVQYLDRSETGEQQGMVELDRVLTQPLDVPACGYRLLHAKDIQVSGASDVENVEHAVAENQWFRIELDPERGGIASLFDKQRGQQWVDPDADWPMGGYIHEKLVVDERNADEYGGRLDIFGRVDWSRFMGYGQWNPDYPVQRETVTQVNTQSRQAWAGRIQLNQTCQAPGTRAVRYELILPDDQPYLDWIVTIDKTWDDAPQACYVTFPFDLPGAAARYETGGAIVRPGHDQLPGSNHDYHTTQRWIDLSNAQQGITLASTDAPIMLWGGFHFARMAQSADEQPVAPWLLNMVMCNYWYTNYAAAQVGEVSFRYRLFPHGPFDPAWSTRIAHEAACPLICHPVKNPDGPRPDQASLMELGDKAIDVLCVKHAQDSKGLILRLRNVADQPRQVTVRLAGAQEAWLCDTLENTTESLKVHDDQFVVSFEPHATLTCRVEMHWQGKGGFEREES